MDFPVFLVGCFTVVYATCLAITTWTYLFFMQQTEDKLRMRDHKIEKLCKKNTAYRSTVDQYKQLFNCHVLGCDLIGTNLVSYDDTDKVHVYCIHHKTVDAKPFIYMKAPENTPENTDSESDNIFSKMTTISSTFSD